MVDRAEGRKKSNFIAKSTVTAGSYCDFWVNNSNYKIAYTDFVGGLGVTGSMAQAGAVTAAPILNIDGTVNNIRGIENGSGVQANVSATDGVELSHSFAADATGSPLFLNTTGTSPVIASLVAGTGITLTSTDNYVTVDSIGASTYGQLSLQDNATATTIAVIDTPVLVAGTWVVGIASQFTGTTAGRLTYTGTPTTTVMAHVSITLAPSTGSNQVLSVYLAKDGTPVANAKVTRSVDSTQTANLSMNFNIEVSTNDYLEIFVSNATTTNDIVVEDCLFGVA
jgi:hypothetical protein